MFLYTLTICYFIKANIVYALKRAHLFVKEAMSSFSYVVKIITFIRVAIVLYILQITQ